eukprot:m.51470 g.51470  ORF g.51470 m.51470 type:complete len:55 (+) comp10736_c0_seq1:2287-2451(+)
MHYKHLSRNAKEGKVDDHTSLHVTDSFTFTPPQFPRFVSPFTHTTTLLLRTISE